jgi:hypothetical protein
MRRSREDFMGLGIERFGCGSCGRSAAKEESDSPAQEEYDQDDDEEAGSASNVVVARAEAVASAAEQQENEEDEENVHEMMVGGDLRIKLVVGDDDLQGCSRAAFSKVSSGLMA